MYQTLEEQSKIRQKLDFFPLKADTYKVAYLRNSEYNTNHRCEKDIDYKSDIAIQYQRKESGNPGMFRYFFREVNIITDGQSKRADTLLFHVNL